MTSSDYAATVVASLDIFVGAYYCTKLIRRETHPRIATWLIFGIGVFMSLAAYDTSHDHSLVKAALNVTDGIVVTTVLISILLVERDEKIRFTKNERLCLLMSGITLLAWALTRTPWIGVAGFQVVMSLAYIPTIENLRRWKPGRPPEPIMSWSANAIAGLIGVLVDITGVHHDYLAMLYPLRAFILCLIVVALLLRWQHRNKVSGVLLR